MAKSDVSHTGKVIAVNPGFTTVVIESASACASCHAAGLCGMGEVKEKVIQVATDPRAGYTVGETVEIILKATMGLKAVWIAYVIPLVILLGVVLGVSALGGGELVAAGAGVGAVALYYLAVYLLRNRLNDTYIFTLKKI